MKKLKRIALIGLLGIMTFCVAPFAVGCGSSGLDVPSAIALDESNVLSWAQVDDARSYLIQVKNVATGESKEYTARKNTYSLTRLETGDYEIRIKAVAGGLGGTDSNWSPVLNFHKEYETGCVYTLINNEEYEITRVGMASGLVLIEDEYLGKPVTSIASSAFKSSSRIEKVEIGNNVTSIGENAFYNCSKLTEVTIPDSVTTIGMAAFQACRALTKINIPKSVTVINDYTFAYCRSLPSITLHDKVASIGESAFSSCSSLKEMNIPDSVTSVGAYAFTANTALETVKIGSSVESLGESAFYKCEVLDEIVFADESSIETIGQYAFSQCKALQAIAIPDGVESIGDWCFYESDLLSEVSIADSVGHVGAFAFSATKLYKDAVEASQDFIYADKWLIGCTTEKKETLTSITIDTLKSGIVGIADQVFTDCA